MPGSRNVSPTARARAAVRSGAFIAVAMAVQNVTNYAFTIIAARRLGPAEYGAVASLMGLLLVVVVLSLGLQATGARKIAAAPERWGDVILARRDTPTSYHLAVVVDDALQGVTHVVRGRDLYHATAVHRLLQRLLGLPEPVYRHHRLILDGSGRKLSKSLRDTSLAALRAAGATPADICRMVGLEPEAGRDGDRVAE